MLPAKLDVAWKKVCSKYAEWLCARTEAPPTPCRDGTKILADSWRCEVNFGQNFGLGGVRSPAFNHRISHPTWERSWANVADVGPTPPPRWASVSQLKWMMFSWATQEICLSQNVASWLWRVAPVCEPMLHGISATIVIKICFKLRCAWIPNNIICLELTTCIWQCNILLLACYNVYLFQL